MSFPEQGHQEILIIKRGSIEDEGHHGGAWKIAFADFMTAMMALFLVLWLINAANEETKRAVASYFNPVKLVDRNRSSKGINEQSDGPTTEIDKREDVGDSANPIKKTTETDEPESKEEAASQVEVDFFAAPLEGLDKIVEADEEDVAASVVLQKSAQETSANAFPDPFMPTFVNGAQSPSVSGMYSVQVSTVDESTELDGDKVPETANPAADGEHQEGAPAKIGEQNIVVMANELESEIRANLDVGSDTNKSVESNIEIKAVQDGILISVSDELVTPMFEIGSAVPESSLVKAVHAIAKSLSNKQGAIHISGHTDARLYKNEVGGNWRLSTDRAKATYFMLLHGGIQNDRIFEIAGFADRYLRVPEDPFAAQNRRIEIFLEIK